MKLVFTDPHSSGLNIIDCDFSSDEIDIAELLDSKNINEDTCGGEIVYFIMINKEGGFKRGYLDFT